MRSGPAANSPGGDFHLSFSAAIPYCEEDAARPSPRIYRRRPDSGAKPCTSCDPRTSGKFASAGLSADALRFGSRVGKAAAKFAGYSRVTRTDSHCRWRTLSQCAAPRQRPQRSFEQDCEGTRTLKRGIARSASHAERSHASHRQSRPPARRSLVTGRKASVADCVARARLEAIRPPPFAPRCLKLRNFLNFLRFL